MTRINEMIRSRLSDVEARIERLRAEFEKAEAEKRDLQTTLRVLDGVGIGDHADAEIVRAKPTQTRPAGEKKKLMLDILDVGSAQGKGPAEVYQELVNSGIDDINIGTVRTTLWRAAKSSEIESGNGAYWKREAEGALFSEPSAHISSAGLTTGETKPIDRWSDQEASHGAS